MKIKIHPSFYRDVKRINDKEIRILLKQTIVKLEEMEDLRSMSNIKKLQGVQKKFYRIKIKEYRVGIEIEEKYTIILMRVLPRKDIYKHFPQK